jgi:thioredoxin 1
MTEFPAGVVLVDFTAKWCGPCRALAPTLRELAAAYDGRLSIVEVDVDDDPILAQSYGVRSMPTLVLLRDRREVGRVIGTRPRAFLAGMIDRAIEGDVAIAAP